MTAKRSASSKHGTRMLSQDERSRIRIVKHASQKGLCAVCGKDLGDERSIDHVVPVSRGGTNLWSNLQLTHNKCNTDKSDK